MFTFYKSWKLVYLWCLFSQNANARNDPRFTNSSTPTTTSAISAVGRCDFCIIEAAGGVRLIYWEPDHAAHPSNVTYNAAQPYTQVENGFTFTSPSVYVVYSQLRATPTCNTNVLETIGPSFAAYTLGYSSSFLAYGTLEIPGPGCTESVIAGGFHTIDFSSLYYNPIVPTTSSKPGCPPWVNPRISMATGLQNVDPSWTTCQPFFAGAYDPPSVLKKQSQLAPPPLAGAGPVTDTGAFATTIPAQAPAAPTPDTPAPTPAADPGNNGPPPNPPAGNSPIPGPVNSSNPPQYTSAPAPADPGNVSGESPAAPAPNPQQAPTNSPNAPPANLVNPPANPPAAPKADPINAPANSAAQTNPNPQNAPPSQAAVPPADPVKAPAINPGAAPPANLQNSPGKLAAAFPVDSQTNTGAHHQGPTQLQIIPNNPPPNAGDRAPKGPAQLQAIPISPPAQSNDAPQNPAQPQINANIPPNVGNLAPQALAQPQTNPENPPPDGGNRAPSGPAPLQNLPINPSGGGNSAPAIPGQPQSSIIAPNGGNGRPAPTSSTQPQNNVDNPPLGGNGNPAQTNAAQPNTINSNPPQAGGNVAAANPAQPQASVNNPIENGNNAAVAHSAAGTAVALPVATPPPPVYLGITEPLAVAGKAVQVAPDGGLLVGGQTIAQGNEATIAGSVISVGTNNVAIGSSTYALPTAAVTTPVALGAPAPLSIGSQAAQYASNGNLLIGSQTIKKGSQATIAGSVVSVGASSLNIGGSILALPVPTYSGVPALPAIGGKPIQQAPSGGVVIADQTIARGSQATVQGSVVSVDSSNVVVGGSIYALPTPTDATAQLKVPATVSVGGKAVQQLSNGGIVVADQTLTPGTQTTISGDVVSVGSSNIALAGTTYSLPDFAGSAPLQTPAPLVIGGNTVQQISDGGLIIGSQTLTPGAQMTISGTTISVGSTAVVVDGTTQTFLPSYNTATGAIQSNEIVLTQGAIVTEGAKVFTYSGPPASAFEQGTSEVVIGSRTLQIGPSMAASANENAALGGLILSALGYNGSSGAASSSLGGTPSGNAGVGPQSTIKPAPTKGAGSRGISCDWLSGRVFVAVAYVAGLGIMMH